MNEFGSIPAGFGVQRETNVHETNGGSAVSRTGCELTGTKSAHAEESCDADRNSPTH